MPDRKIGTREEWQAARDELAKLEAEHTELGRKAAEKRRELPWGPVEKEYVFGTADFAALCPTQLEARRASIRPSFFASGRCRRSLA